MAERTHFNFEDLQVYQKALDFVELAYETAQLFLHFNGEYRAISYWLGNF